MSVEKKKAPVKKVPTKKRRVVVERLTEKGKRFACGLFEGLSQREAYKKACDCAGKTDKAIDEAACRLARNRKVQEYLDGLNKKAESPKIMTKRERMEWLSRAIKAKPDEIDGSSDLCQEASMTMTGPVYKMPSKIAAIAELNRMDGAYEPEKIEVKGLSEIAQVLANLKSEPLVRRG